MKKRLIVPVVLLAFIMLLIGCEKHPQSEKPISTTSTVEGEIIIEEIHVKEEPLSEIKTDEEDLYANALRDRVQSINFTHDQDNVCHGVLTEGYQDYYIVSYYNGKEEKLFDDRIYYYYCNNEGIYYAIEDNIFFISYFEGEPELILKIPEEIYFNVSDSIFVIYKGFLWIGTYETSRTNWPLIKYDYQNNTLTKFDKGGLDAVNNGFIYFVDEYNEGKLYRFDCEKCTIQLVSDIRIKTFDFINNHILYNDFDSLYRMDSNSNYKILSADQIKRGTNILGVRCKNNHIYVNGADDPEDFWEIEIDINGNIIK